jgi:hypothetical protein
METTINLCNVVDFWANILNQGLPLATRPRYSPLSYYYKDPITILDAQRLPNRIKWNNYVFTEITERPALLFDPPGQKNIVQELVPPTSLNLKSAVIIN